MDRVGTTASRQPSDPEVVSLAGSTQNLIGADRVIGEVVEIVAVVIQAEEIAHGPVFIRVRGEDGVGGIFDLGVSSAVVGGLVFSVCGVSDGL